MWKEQLSHLNKAKGYRSPLYISVLAISKAESRRDVNTCCMLSFKSESTSILG
nr:MAG TPA: hypothetical protein [Crassvirales sp.]